MGELLGHESCLEGNSGSRGILAGRRGYRFRIRISRDALGIDEGPGKGAEKAALGAPAESERFLVYEGSVAGLDCKIIYEFIGPEMMLAEGLPISPLLTTGSYRITQEAAGGRVYFDFYERLEVLLRKKYGEPSRSGMEVEYPFSAPDRSEWLAALGAGKLKRYAGWRVDDTLIRVMLWGSMEKPWLVVMYEFKAVAEKKKPFDLEKAFDEEKALEQL